MGGSTDRKPFPQPAIPHLSSEGGPAMPSSHARRWQRRLSLPAAFAAALITVTLVNPAGATPADDGTQFDLGRIAGEQTSVVEVQLAGVDELDRLVATGVDLDHGVERAENGVV